MFRRKKLNSRWIRKCENSQLERCYPYYGARSSSQFDLPTCQPTFFYACRVENPQGSNPIVHTDEFPDRLEFEIDRPLLLRYWRIQAIFACCTVALPWGILIGAMLAQAYGELHGTRNGLNWLAINTTGLASGGAAGIVVGLAVYLAVLHLPIKLAACKIRLVVDGSYLRVVSGTFFISDRRIHFRAISDYSTHDGLLLRQLGLKRLSFRVCGGNHARAFSIVGLNDAEAVCDQLCSIDAARE